jgi:hypothetical protein
LDFRKATWRLSGSCGPISGQAPCKFNWRSRVPSKTRSDVQKFVPCSLFDVWPRRSGRANATSHGAGFLSSVFGPERREVVTICSAFDCSFPGGVAVSRLALLQHHRLAEQIVLGRLHLFTWGRAMATEQAGGHRSANSPALGMNSRHPRPLPTRSRTGRCAWIEPKVKKTLRVHVAKSRHLSRILPGWLCMTRTQTGRRAPRSLKRRRRRGV